MSNEPYTTVTGNLVEDPTLRFTASGAAVCNVAIASTPRSFNKDQNEWSDGETWFVRGSIWRQPAENIAESLTKGMRVVVYGRLKQRNWEKDGVKHSVIEMDIEDIGPSLKYATAKVTRSPSSGGGSGYANGGGSSTPASAPADDPWGSAPATGGGSGGGSYADEPPF